MKTFIITEDEKDKILNLHIERTKNLYLTEQSVKDLTDKGFKLSNDKTHFSKEKNDNNGTKGTIFLFRGSDKKYQFDVNGITKEKGTWSWVTKSDGTKVVKYTKTPPPPVTNELPEWAECIKEEDLFKNIKVTPNDKNFVSQKDLAGNLNLFSKDGKYFLKGIGNTIIERGKWKCFPMIGLFIEYTNGRKYFNGKFYDIIKAKKIPSLISLIADGEKLAGKIGDKLVKWYNDTEEWIKDNSGGGSSNDNKPCTPLTDSEKKGDTFYDIRIPGDTKYIYGKDGNGNWYTKNTVNGKEFNLTKCGYTKAIKKLEKEGKKVSSPQKIEPNKVTSAPNDKVNIAYVPSTTEPKPEPKPLPNSDKVTDSQEEMSATTKL